VARIVLISLLIVLAALAAALAPAAGSIIFC
jgi:hypothetical protein